jgi:uncharacterized protein (DUF1501 family)
MRSAVDQPTAALIADLEQRGLLADTLVIWGGEFGRTSYAQGSLSDTMGRDHHGGCFADLLAGGGVRGGVSYGDTDELSYNIVKNPVTVHDLHATIAHHSFAMFDAAKETSLQGTVASSVRARMP